MKRNGKISCFPCILLSLFFLFGCESGKKKGEDPAEDSSGYTSRSSAKNNSYEAEFATELKEALINSGVEEVKAEYISASALDRAYALTLSLTNLTQLNELLISVPLLIEGAMECLSNENLDLSTNQEKELVIGMVFESIIRSIGLRIDNIGKELSKEIRNEVIKRSVANLDESGLENSAIPGALKILITKAIENLPNSGTLPTESMEELRNIVFNASLGLSEASLELSLVLRGLNIIASSAVSNLNQANSLSENPLQALENIVDGTMAAANKAGIPAIDLEISWQGIVSSALTAMPEAGINTAEQKKTALISILNGAVKALSEEPEAINQSSKLIESIVRGAIIGTVEASLTGKDLADATKISASTIIEALVTAETNGSLLDFAQSVTKGAIAAIGALINQGKISLDIASSLSSSAVIGSVAGVLAVKSGSDLSSKQITAIVSAIIDITYSTLTEVLVDANTVSDLKSAYTKSLVLDFSENDLEKATGYSPPEPLECDLYSNKSGYLAGNTAILTLQTTGLVTAASIGNKKISLSEGKGTLSVLVTKSENYQATILGPHGSATCEAAITLFSPVATCTITANPTSIGPGETSLLTITIAGEYSSVVLNSDPVAMTESTKEISVAPVISTDYEVTVTSPGGETICSTRVATEFVISASPNPASGAQFGYIQSVGSSMGRQRTQHCAALLSNGQVLIAGGYYHSALVGYTYESATELFYPASNSFSLGPEMGQTKKLCAIVALDSGKALIYGGQDAAGSTPLSSAEIYDPSSGITPVTGNGCTSTVARAAFSGTRLNNGKIIFMGGGSTTAELFDPSTGCFAPGGTTHFNSGTSILLADGKVLFVGNNAKADLYDPDANTFCLTTGNQVTQRSGAGLILLSDNKILIVGGIQELVNSAEIYDPATGTFSATNGNLSQTRWMPALVPLPSGKIAVVGGNAISSLVEIYDPSSKLFSSASRTTTTYAYWGHQATLLANGTLLLTGGNYLGNFSQLYEPRYSAKIYLNSEGSSGATTYELIQGSGQLVNNGNQYGYYYVGFTPETVIIQGQDENDRTSQVNITFDIAP